MSPKKTKDGVEEPFVFVLGDLLLHYERKQILVYRLLDELPVYTYQEALSPVARPPPYGVFKVPRSVSGAQGDHQRAGDEKSAESK